MKRILYTIIIASMVFAINSCVEDEIFVGPASISNVSNAPVAPQSTQTVDVTAKITDLKGITSATLYYKLSTASTYTSVAMAAQSNFIYKGTIPAFPKDANVKYYIQVVNSDGLISVYPSAAPTSTASYVVGASTVISLFINEAMPDGTKDATDPDWVEIYNNSEIPVDLSGYAFYDEGIKTGAKPKRILASGTTIPAKGFLVLTTEYNGEAVTFGLSTSGDAAYLENTSGIVVASLDFNTVAVAGKKSYGRKPDGSSTLVIFNTPTKGTSNNDAN
jgi:hypothetical protein